MVVTVTVHNCTYNDKKVFFFFTQTLVDMTPSICMNIFSFGKS